MAAGLDYFFRELTLNKRLLISCCCSCRKFCFSCTMIVTEFLENSEAGV